MTKTILETKIDAIDKKLDVHIAMHGAIASCLSDYGVTLYGPNRDDGLVSKVNVHDDRLKMVYAIFGTLGAATVGLLVWLVQNSLTVARALAAVK